jgi:hypothetical protein
MKNNTPIKSETIIDAKLDQLAGLSDKEIAAKNGVSPARLNKAILRVDEVMNDKTELFSVERQIIKEAISDRLMPLKEELAIKSLEILRKADIIVSDRLDAPELISTKEALKISDTHSRRLARIVGLEEDPNAGGADPEERAKTVNIFVQNIFKSHNDKLKQERDGVNDTTLTPVYEADIISEKEAKKE